MSDVHGVWPAVEVPFTESDAIDYESLRREIEFLAEGDCHGLILFALASEPFKLSDEERRELTEVALDEAGRHDIPLYTSVTDRTTVNAVEWAQWFADAGVDGLMILPPFDNDPDTDAVVEHLRRIGETVSLPIIVQHTEANTGVPPERFAALHEEVHNVRIFKIEVDPPGPFIESLVEEADEDVSVLVGGGGREMIDALDRGANGVIPGGALQEIYLQLYHSYVDGDRDSAIEYHKDVLLFLNAIDDGDFIHYEKQLMQRRGVFETARVRAPTHDVNEGTEELVHEYFEKLQHHFD